MASLNLSINGPSIRSSYQGVVNASPPPPDSSSTYGQWALFSVQAPLASAFQDSGSKESVLKVSSTGEGELEELVEDFSEGRIQFAFLKVKDPNTGLPKFALIAWCGGGVPERTKGYFTSHVNAVSKVLHGYHIQITARSDSDLDPANILQKVADASGSKYTAGGSAPMKTSKPPPPARSKPVFSSASSSHNPIVAARNAALRSNTNDDGWGDDAPPVSRSEIQKVQSAYTPTRVNIDELRNQKQAPSAFQPSAQPDDRSGIIGGSYQPVGKVDIGALRAAAKNEQDNRPAPVKGSYEPVGKVDIAAIRSRSQKPAEEEEEHRPKPVSERSSAFDQSERIIELPKPKVTKKFGGAAAFTGTKPPTPGGTGLWSPQPTANAPVASASRTFADQGGKTPAQLWAERKAQQGGAPKSASPAATSPVVAQKSGGTGWQSGYTGKSWAPVQQPTYGRELRDETADSRDASAASPEPVTSVRDRFKEEPTVIAPAPGARKSPPPTEEREAPPSVPMGARPSGSAPTGGFALPGMPPRPPPPTDEPEEEEEEEEEAEPIRVAVPISRGPGPEIHIQAPQEPESSLPIRPIERELPNEEDLSKEQDSQDPRAASTHVAEALSRKTSIAWPIQNSDVADLYRKQSIAWPPPLNTSGGMRALVQFDYEPAEDNELELKEGDYVINIDMVDDDWWLGTNQRGEIGLFPSNYVEVVEEEPEAGGPTLDTVQEQLSPVAESPVVNRLQSPSESHIASAPQPAPISEPALLPPSEPRRASVTALAPAGISQSTPPPHSAPVEPEEPETADTGANGQGGATATAQFDYEAAEDNELSFPEGATVTELEFPDEDWWYGAYNGKTGLFPANYVELDK